MYYQNTFLKVLLQYAPMYYQNTFLKVLILLASLSISESESPLSLEW